MRIVLLLLFIGLFGWNRVSERSYYVPRRCIDGFNFKIQSKEDYFEELSDKYEIDRINRKADLSHVIYLVEGLKRYQIPERIGIRWVRKESDFDSCNVSPVGAFGYCQLMPGTWRDVSCCLQLQTHNSINNIEAGMFYLSEQYKKFGRWDLALAAYNAGPNRKCLQQGRIPRIDQTEKYVKFILK